MPKWAGKKKYEWAICHGHQQSYPWLDAKVEIPTVQLVGFKTTRDKIQELYNDVYQLRRHKALHCMAQNALKS